MEDLLVIIDPQVDFIGQNGFYSQRHGINQITDAANEIEQLVRQWNGRVLIIYSNYAPGQFGEDVNMCIAGTPGHEIALSGREQSIQLPKCAHSAFSSEEFTSFLKNNDIRKFYLCGFLAEYCIRETAIDAIKSGFETTLLTRCIATGDDRQDKRLMVLKELEDLGCILY